MRDLALVAFLVAFMGMGLRRPFLLVLAYVYIDVVSPQRLSYFLLNSLPISLIAFVLAVGAWAFAEKSGARFTARQGLIFLLMLYCGLTTLNADFPIQAAEKWSWVWKALLFAMFLPLTLTTRLRIEALSLTMVLSAASIIIVGGIKTLASGGGYGMLNLMVTNNTGLYESSIISCVAVAIIPLILYLRTHGTIFPPEWRVSLFCFALCFACLLIPVGTEARTGLVCIAVLAVLALRTTKRRMLYLSLMVAAGLVAVPFLPKSFTTRMDTIGDYQADASASTRVAVWKWTWEYVQLHPMGGGFDAYLQNSLRYESVQKTEVESTTESTSRVVTDKARAYHSSYFEMLGEQGFAGLIMWLLIHGIGILRMEVLYRRYRRRAEDDGQWISSIALALQQGHIVYMVGSLFVGIAFQPFVYMLVGLQIGLDSYARRRDAEGRWKPFAVGAHEPARI